MELTEIPGIGPTKAKRLQEAGIATVQDLAAIDLRKPLDVNIGNDVLKRAKQEARKALRSEGKSFDKAPYRSQAESAATPAVTAGRKEGRTETGTVAAKRDKKKQERPMVEMTKKEETGGERTGFLARLFKRN